MKFFSPERMVWVAGVALVIYATIVTTNYVRDHNVYRETAKQCSGDKSVLHQEIERRSAEIEKQDQVIDQLKSLPVR